MQFAYYMELLTLPHINPWVWNLQLIPIHKALSTTKAPTFFNKRMKDNVLPLSASHKNCILLWVVIYNHMIHGHIVMCSSVCGYIWPGDFTPRKLWLMCSKATCSILQPALLWTTKWKSYDYDVRVLLYPCKVVTMTDECKSTHTPDSEAALHNKK